MSTTDGTTSAESKATAVLAEMTRQAEAGELSDTAAGLAVYLLTEMRDK